jgi:hypothetical protein
MVKRLSFPIKVQAQYLNIHNNITINKKLKKLGGDHSHPWPPLSLRPENHYMSGVIHKFNGNAH